MRKLRCCLLQFLFGALRVKASKDNKRTGYYCNVHIKKFDFLRLTCKQKNIHVLKCKLYVSSLILATCISFSHI